MLLLHLTLLPSSYSFPPPLPTTTITNPLFFICPLHVVASTSPPNLLLLPISTAGPTSIHPPAPPPPTNHFLPLLLPLLLLLLPLLSFLPPSPFPVEIIMVSSQSLISFSLYLLFLSTLTQIHVRLGFNIQFTTPLQRMWSTITTTHGDPDKPVVEEEEFDESSAEEAVIQTGKQPQWTSLFVVNIVFILLSCYLRVR